MKYKIKIFRFQIVFTFIVATIGSIVNKVLFTMPEFILPAPKEQLNTNFSESKVLFKFVDINNISTFIFIICMFLIAVIWVKKIREVLK